VALAASVFTVSAVLTVTVYDPAGITASSPEPGTAFTPPGPVQSAAVLKSPPEGLFQV
jgi:hypothetical protein